MDPNLLLTTIQTVARAFDGFFAYLRTEQGQRQAAIWIDDQERFREDLAEFASWFDRAVTGGQ